MFITNKYKQNLLLNFNNLNVAEAINSKTTENINYIFTYKSKFMRNFIFFYSLFLLTNQFSFIHQKNNPNFIVKFYLNNLFFLNNDYNSYF